LWNPSAVIYMLAERGSIRLWKVGCPVFGSLDWNFTRSSHISIHATVPPVAHLVTVFGEEYKLRDLLNAYFQTPRIYITLLLLVLAESSSAD
jgi:hypothetical protein